MDVIEIENIKVPNSLIVTGVTNTVVDEELYEFLKKFGSIDRVIKVSEKTSEFHGKVIVEYAYGDAVEVLERDLPLDRTSDKDGNVVFHIETLASVYSEQKGTGLTKTFLSELQNIAKLSGRSFEDVVHDELARIAGVVGKFCQSEQSEFVQAPTPVSPEEPPFPDVTGLDIIDPNSNLDPPSSTYKSPATTGPVYKEPASFPLPSSDHLNPPEVQRVVVEHIVKTSDLVSQIHAPAKLRPFSGRVPCPNYEVDYDTWRNSVECHLADSTVSSGQLVRKIIDSLLPPAATMVKSLSPHASPKAFLDVLDSAYATVEDGDELFAQFLNVNQNSGERPSNYLQRLQTILDKVVKMRTIRPQDSDKHLLKQFCRGCWNNALITALQLEQRKDSPPTFPELLLLLRTEEDKQTSKANRMKQYLGFQKPKAQAAAQMHDVYLSDAAEYNPQGSLDTPPVAVQQIQRQIVELQAQIASLSSSKQGKMSAPKPEKRKDKAEQKEKTVNKIQKTPGAKINSRAMPATFRPKPKPWYCFRCGEDGHIASNCNDPPNPTLVSVKRNMLKEKQQAYEKNNPLTEQSLN